MPILYRSEDGLYRKGCCLHGRYHTAQTKWSGNVQSIAWTKEVIQYSSITNMTAKIFSTTEIGPVESKSSPTALPSVYITICWKLRIKKARLGWHLKYIRSSMEWMEGFLGVNPYTRWYNIVLEFSCRKLTKDTDTFPALAGIARAFASVAKDTLRWDVEVRNTDAALLAKRCADDDRGYRIISS
jgi:hypothetical protein